MPDSEALNALCYDLAGLMKPLGLLRINIHLRTTSEDTLNNIWQTLGLLGHMTDKCKEIVEYEENELENIESALGLREFIERELEKRG